MSTAELKNDLIQIILNTEDIDFLKGLKDMFKSRESSGDWWDEISDEEKKMIAEGDEDFDAGRTVTYEQVRSEIRQIIEKKKTR